MRWAILHSLQLGNFYVSSNNINTNELKRKLTTRIRYLLWNILHKCFIS